MLRFFVTALSSVFLLSACSSTFKARQEQREKMAASSGLYCEFVDGDQHPDTDVELNMQMSRRCDATRSFSITNYKNSSSRSGVMYCCTMAGYEPRVVRRERIAPPPPAPRTQAPAPAPTAIKAAPDAEAADDVVGE